MKRGWGETQRSGYGFLRHWTIFSAVPKIPSRCLSVSFSVDSRPPPPQAPGCSKVTLLLPDSEPLVGVVPMVALTSK